MTTFVEEQIEAIRARFAIPGHVAVRIARAACRVCGCSGIMGTSTCCLCGATGHQRTSMFGGNDPVSA